MITPQASFVLLRNYFRDYFVEYWRKWNYIDMCNRWIIGGLISVQDIKKGKSQC